jgi:acyl carrier protein
MRERGEVVGGDADVEEILLRFIAEEVAIDGAGLRVDERLVESGRIDSLGLVNILAFVVDRFRVDLVATGQLRDLESVAALAAAIRRERSTPGAA